MSHPPSSEALSDHPAETGDDQRHPGNGSAPNGHRSSPQQTPSTLDREDPSGLGEPPHRNEGTDHNSHAHFGGRGPWLILLGLVVMGGVGYGGWQLIDTRSGDDQMQQQSPQALRVELSQVETATVEETSAFPGTLAAEQVVGIQPQRPGEVQQILVQEGQQVAQGDPLVQLGTTREEADLEAAQAQKEVSQAAQTSAAAELEALRAERSELQAELTLQQEQIRRFRFLVEQGALAPEELDIRQRDLEAAQSDLNTLERQIEAAVARLEEARARSRQDQANLRSIRENVQDTTVVAPFQGTVGLIPIEVGDYVNTGETLTNLVGDDRLELTIEVPQERLTDLQIGLPVRIETAEGQTLTSGEITLIAPQVDTDSQLVSTKATFPNPDHTLQDGQFVQATVVWEQRPDRIVVPQTAVTYRGDRRFVYLAQRQEDQTVAIQQFLELGVEQGTRIEVTQGLAKGDRIVTSGIQKLFDGAPIQPRSTQPTDSDRGQPESSPGESSQTDTD